MIVNEIAQWAVLVFVAAISLGLLRQLGSQVAPRGEEAAREYGPDIGSPLPQVLFSNAEWDTVRELAAGSRDNALAIVFLDESCEACDKWQESLEKHGGLDGVPMVAYVNGDGHDVTGLEEVADLVVHDRQREVMNDVNVRATPFLVVTDGRLEVEYKQVGGHPHEGIENWKRKTKRAGAKPDQLEITTTKAGVR